MLNIPGAVSAQGHDQGVTAHFGSLTKDQKKLLASRKNTFVHLANHGILQLHGSDAQDWLNSLTSQELMHLKSGESAETLILTPQGRVEHQLKVIKDEDFLWLLVEGHDKDTAKAWLKSMVFMKDIQIKDVSDKYAVLGALTNETKLKPTAIWIDNWAEVQPGGHAYGDTIEDQGAWSYAELILPNSELEELKDQVNWVGIDAFEALRIMAARPRFGFETDDKTIPHELNWLRSAVHLNKGCYRGQETVAKVHNVGHPPRRLVLLHVDGSNHAFPKHGQEVLQCEKVVGKVTTGGFHHEWGPVALAIIKRTVPADAQLKLKDGSACSQEIVVPLDAGATVIVDRKRFLSNDARKPLM
ncbi:MAG: folate-binding protein [Micrococcaceae bacterium]